MLAAFRKDKEAAPPVATQWNPMPLGYLTERYGLENNKFQLILVIWVLLFSACIASVIYLVPKNWNTLEPDREAVSFFLTFYTPLIISNFLLFWLGFEWGFIPAYLSTFLIAFSSGMPVYWSMLFGIAVVLGLAVYALVYYSVPMPYDIHSVSSLAFFVGVSFVASMAASLGSFIWSHTHNLTIAQTLIVWKGWWTGTFLQAVFINAPILFLFSRPIERIKQRHFDTYNRPDISLKWIYGSIITVVVVLAVFIWAAQMLGSLRMAEELSQFPNASQHQILGATESFQLTAWISVVLVFAAGLGGIKLVSNWNDSLKNQVEFRTGQLQESERRFRSTFEQAAVGVSHVSPQGDWLRVNDKLCEITGYSRAELLQLKFQNVTHPEDLEENVKSFNQVLNGELDTYSGEKRYIRKNNDPVWVQQTISSVPDEDGQSAYLISVIEDITDRKKMEAALWKEKSFSDSVINSLPGIFYLIDDKGNFRRWNRNFADVSGYSDEEISHMQPADFFEGEDQTLIREKIQEVFETGASSVEATFISKNGNSTPYFYTGMRFQSGSKKYLIGVGIDISDRKRYEEKIQLSLREKETLLAEIHHRVKNNLAVVSALLELQAGTSENNETRNILQQAESRIKSMAMVHKQLYQSETLSEIYLDEYTEQLANTIFTMFSNIDTDIQIHNDTERVGLDINQAIPCGLILNEILVNAFKHAFKGRDEGNIYIRARQLDNEAILIVKDDGVGLPEDIDIMNLNSLGMKLIKTLTKQLHASLDIENVDGASFTIRFEIQKEELSSSES